MSTVRGDIAADEKRRPVWARLKLLSCAVRAVWVSRALELGSIAVYARTERWNSAARGPEESAT